MIASALAGTATAADAPTLVAPKSAAIGAALSISATGLKPGFFYRATLDQEPGTYRWIVGRKIGRASWDTHATLLVQRVRITKAATRLSR